LQYAIRPLRDLIESLGYDVATFGSAERFLEAECLAETSCLITDLQMPGLSGLDLQGQLMADGHRIPVIFVTAFPHEKFQGRAMRAGTVGFLSKPFDESSLISCLETALSPLVVPPLLNKPRYRLRRAADVCHEAAGTEG
jgi:FixJ family two-component response regulator